MKKPFAAALTVLTLLTSTLASAAWQIDNARSELSFVTTKAGKAGTASVLEVQQFKQFKGSLSDGGDIVLTIELASVSTGVELRDQRLRELLFTTAKFPQASFSAKIDSAPLKTLKTGQFKDLELRGQLTLSGVTQDVSAALRVVALENGQLQVSTRQPLLVNLQNFGLQKGVETLQSMMSLAVVSATAPVSLSLHLNPAK